MAKHLELEKVYEDTVAHQRLVNQYCEETWRLQDEHIASLRDIETLYEATVNTKERIGDLEGEIREDQRDVLVKNLNLLVKRFEALQEALNSGGIPIDIFSRDKSSLYQEFTLNKEKTLKLLAESNDLNRSLSETKFTLDCEVANNEKLTKETTVISKEIKDMRKAQERFKNRVFNASQECESVCKDNKRLELLKRECEEEIRQIYQTENELRVKSQKVVHHQASPVSTQATRQKPPLPRPSPLRSSPSPPRSKAKLQDERKIVHSAQYESRVLSTRYVPILLFFNVIAILLLHVYSTYK